MIVNSIVLIASFAYVVYFIDCDGFCGCLLGCYGFGYGLFVFVGLFVGWGVGVCLVVFYCGCWVCCGVYYVVGIVT